MMRWPRIVYVQNLVGTQYRLGFSLRQRLNIGLDLCWPGGLGVASPLHQDLECFRLVTR
ncbi:MAG: hypothetical protein NTW87_00995 [Planctomycetota bacterium]|nr:hypothetical protein [Planctomycetota bacterium]